MQLNYNFSSLASGNFLENYKLPLLLTNTVDFLQIFIFT